MTKSKTKNKKIGVEKTSEEKKEEKGFSLEKLNSQEGKLAVDVYQTAKEIIIQSTVAGITPEELNISIENDIIIIKGNRERPNNGKDINYFYQECYWGPFSRQIILPEEVSPSKIKATMEKGVLTISLPKTQRKKKREIVIEKK